MDNIQGQSNEKYLGRRLKRDVFNSRGTVVAAARTELKEAHLRLLVHAMISNRDYQSADTFFDTLQQLRDGSFGKLDPVIVHVFLNQIMRVLVGHEVLLSNGSISRIVWIQPYDALKPLVWNGISFHDLSKEPELQIERVII